MTRRPPTPRRTFLKAGLAAGAAIAAPARLTAQPAPSAAKTIRAVMHSDLTVLDPIWTTANMTAYHGAMLYDTLFGIDANLETKPANGGEMGALGGQENLDVRAARRPQVQRRHRRHLRRRHRLAAPLGRPRRCRPALDAACRRHRQKGRQDLPIHSQGALRLSGGRAGQDLDAALLHHAQE